VTHSADEQPDQPAPAPSVSTAPPGTRRRRIPAHLGPARTSTVILAVVWLALGALYLNVRPDNPATASSGSGTSVESTEPDRTTTPPASTTATEPTTTEPSSSESTAPTSSTETGTTTPTTPTTVVPSEPTVSSEPTLPAPTSVSPAPTAGTFPTG
jgi:hypothetical protein